MGKKNAHKRQRTEKSTLESIQPLGSKNMASLLDDSAKDDEERRLESALFGTAYVPAEKSEDMRHMLAVSDEELNEGLLGGNELRAILDNDLFVVDDAVLGIPTGRPVASIDVKFGEPSDSGSEEDEKEGEQVMTVFSNEPELGGQEEGENEDYPLSAFPSSSSHKHRKAPAWVDPDDANLQVSLSNNKRLRKLRDAPSDNVVGGTEYERRLRRQFERINPMPDWAAKARKKLHPSKKAKRRRSSVSPATSSDESADEGHLEDLLTSTGGILGQRKAGILQQGTLSIERLRDANISARSEGAVKALQFHPSLPLLLTAGGDRRLKLFNIDRHTNPHIQTVHVPSLPMTTALFHPSGSSILLTGHRPFFYTFDLQSGAVTRSPRGLWGTTFNGPTVQDSSMEICAFDATGEVLAVAGKGGYVHLVDWKSGTGQVVESVKMNATAKAVWWTRGERQGELMTLAEDGEVYVWDVAARRCLKRWRDDGGFGNHGITGDHYGRYIGIGSRHGLVSMYQADSASSAGSQKPTLLKTIGNLTTSITSLRFNHDSQLLAIASNVKKDQLRMVHLPSLTAFSNWPTSGTPLGHVTSIDFSSGSEYVAIGNTRGRVLLYHLRDFPSQP